jgi:penicillin G amidase
MSFAVSAAEAARTAAGRLTGLSRAISRATTHSSVPQADGMLGIRGADGLIEVIRDRHGVPHIFASTAADACFGHGFVHAQDRLFQMEGARRVAAGRLSEVLGRSGLASDRLLRRVGLARAARRDAVAVAAAGGRASTLLEAYARGVNEGVRHLPALPPEFALLCDHFEPWTVADVMLVGRYVMFGFAGNWNTELVREQLADVLGPELASAVDPVHPPASTVTGERYPRSAARLLESYEAAVAAGMPAGGASNAWAVTSALSATAAPLLASDPHVDVALPGIFHVAHLSGGDLDVVGAGVPGVPGVMIGHNQRVAWGLTAGMADVSDCYVEEFDPREPSRYRTPDGWATAEVRAERFEILGEPAVTEQVLVTRHGPVVSPALRGERRAIALRSTVVEGSDVASPFVALWHANGIDEARRAISEWPGTTFNFILADRDDRVAYQFAGQVPQRERGQGLFPQMGATSPRTMRRAATSSSGRSGASRRGRIASAR